MMCIPSITTILMSSIIVPIILGVLTTLIGWYITTVALAPKLNISDVKRDVDGVPFISIQNESRYLNAYKIFIFITYYDGQKPVYTKIKKHPLITTIEQQSLDVNLKIENDKIEGANISEKNYELDIHVICYNKFGVATAINKKERLDNYKVRNQ